tara:strand:- start:35 stop:214 length:180 start_codon:yes stop_codon:yes gene_type:complete
MVHTVDGLIPEQAFYFQIALSYSQRNLEPQGTFYASDLLLSSLPGLLKAGRKQREEDAF